MQKVLPNAHSSYCALHLERNVSVNFKAAIKNNIFIAARATTLAEFEDAMDIIQTGPRNGQKVYAYLMSSKENWANVYFPIPRYNVLTSNAAESFNAKISDERLGSYLYVFTSFSDKLAVYFYANHTRMQLVEYEIPVHLKNKREAYIELGRKREITQVGPDLFTVSPLASRAKPDKSNRVVDLAQRTCSCAKWQEMGLPCLHAYGVLFKLHMENEIEFISSKFHYAEMKKAFCHFHKPVDVSNIQADGVTTLAPVSRKRGRPKLKRIRSMGEYARVGKKKCGRCGKQGHYSTTCFDSSEGSQKRQISCSVCKMKGHNRVTCPNTLFESSNSNTNTVVTA